MGSFCDDPYLVAGHKGKPDQIQGRAPRRRQLQGSPGRGTLEKERPPIFGMIERGGEVRIVMLENVQQQTIRPLIEGLYAQTAEISERHRAVRKLLID